MKCITGIIKIKIKMNRLVCGKNNHLKWGIVGNNRIGDYSIAPAMWKALFEELKIPIKYLIIGSNNRKTISHKISLLKKDNNFIGANIAVPWKGVAFGLCDKTHLFDKLEVVNIILRNNKNELIGYNSDGIGLIRGIKKYTSIKNKNIVLFGAGGSAQTIPLYLFKNNVKTLYINDIIINKAVKLVSVYSSLYDKEKKNIKHFFRNEIEDKIKEADILINATPCGMIGHKRKFPFKKELIKKIKKTCLVVDTAYNPRETPLLEEAKHCGNSICEGYNMLIEQAVVSFEHAFGFKLNNSNKKVMKKAIIREYEK